MIQTDIAQTILCGKLKASQYGVTLITKEKNGEDVQCCEVKLMVLVRWIKSLQSFYFDNYNVLTGNITPTIDCLTLAQATELMGKINSLVGSLGC